VRLVAMGSTGAAANVMLGAGRERAVAGLLVVEAAAAVTAMLVLVRPLGVTGIAWATAAPTVVSALVVWPWLLRGSFGVGLRAYALAAWARPVAATLPFAGATWLVERLWPAPSLAVFIAQTTLLLPIAVAGIWLAGLPAAERRRGRALVRGLRSGGVAV
jgi:peptidoglycan biosynthesis protein MviN/MurJ (putative lipid II flippase)